MKLKNRIRGTKNSKKKSFINGHTKLNKKYLLIIILLFIFSMGCSYAILSKKLTVGGKATIYDNKILKIVDISVASKTTGAINLYYPTYYELTPTFNLCLEGKSDSITYLITIKNNSSNDKVLNSVSIDNINNNDITYTLENISIKDVVQSNTGKTFKIKIKYKDEVTEINNTCVGISINFDFIDSD